MLPLFKTHLRDRSWDSRKVTASSGGQEGASRRNTANEAASSFAQPLDALRTLQQPPEAKPAALAPGAPGAEDRRTQVPSAAASKIPQGLPRGALPGAPTGTAASLKQLQDARRRVTAPEQQRPLGGAAAMRAAVGGGGGPAIMAPRQPGPKEDPGLHFELLELQHRRRHRSEGGAGPAAALMPAAGPSLALALAAGRLPSVDVGSLRDSGSSHAITEEEYEGIRLPGAPCISDAKTIVSLCKSIRMSRSILTLRSSLLSKNPGTMV